MGCWLSCALPRSGLPTVLLALALGLSLGFIFGACACLWIFRFLGSAQYQPSQLRHTSAPLRVARSHWISSWASLHIRNFTLGLFWFIIGAEGPRRGVIPQPRPPGPPDRDRDPLDSAPSLSPSRPIHGSTPLVLLRTPWKQWRSYHAPQLRMA